MWMIREECTLKYVYIFSLRISSPFINYKVFLISFKVVKSLIWYNVVKYCGQGSVVGIAAGYGLGGPGSNSVGARFSAPVQTGPGAHPASFTMGTGSFPGVKSGRGVTLTPHPLLVPLVKKK
jgi:hypothetical protein